MISYLGCDGSWSKSVKVINQAPCTLVTRRACELRQFGAACCELTVRSPSCRSGDSCTDMTALAGLDRWTAVADSDDLGGGRAADARMSVCFCCQSKAGCSSDWCMLVERSQDAARVSGQSRGLTLAVGLSRLEHRAMTPIERQGACRASLKHCRGRRCVQTGCVPWQASRGQQRRGVGQRLPCSLGLSRKDALDGGRPPVARARALALSRRRDGTRRRAQACSRRGWAKAEQGRRRHFVRGSRCRRRRR